jgi:alkylation response protein AidB-like acyl-CoA dehydrogenase
VDVRLSPEHKALRDAAARVANRLGPDTVGQLADRDRNVGLDAAVVESGWRELREGDEDGRPLASAVEVSLVAEELGRRSADTAFIGPTLAADLRRLAGAPAATERETVGLTTDLGALALVGANAVAVDAAGAISALVIEPIAGGYRLVSAPLNGGDTGIDLSRQTVPLLMANTFPVGGQERILTADDISRWTAFGLATSVADLVGVMEGATALTIKYAKERRQFGKPIASFQALRHLMADMVVYAEGARSAGLHAAWAVDALTPSDALGYAAMAKAYAARGARIVCETSIQVHGGIGNTWECMAHVFLRRSQLAADLLGGVGPNLTRVLKHAGIGGN